VSKPIVVNRKTSPADRNVPKTVIPAGFSAAVAQVITGAGSTLPAPWKIADPANAVKSPGASVDVTTPRVVTFDMDFSAAAAGDEFALLAIVHRVPDQGADTGPVLTGATLEELVLKNFQAASRVVVVKG
jgi:hypothetical protein